MQTFFRLKTCRCRCANDCLLVTSLIMPAFTSDDYVNMVLIYGECRRNARATVAMYQERYPDRRLPNEKTVRNVGLRLSRLGAFRRPHIQRPYSAFRQRHHENAPAVLAYVDLHPTTSIK